MSIYVIADLHLSFNENLEETKPMNIFGINWNNHAEKIKNDWMSKVEENDTVFLPGDFSWAMNLKDTLKDFEYLNNLPGNKILSKGNHDYWWTTVTNIKKFLKENNISKIDFLYNNSFKVEDKVFCGTRGWSLIDKTESKMDTELNEKIINRECGRLKLSIEDAIKKYGTENEIIVFLHYPPLMKSDIKNNIQTPFMQILKQYNIKKCYYGHLHGNAIQEAVEGLVDGVELKLISADSVGFKLTKIE